MKVEASSSLWLSKVIARSNCYSRHDYKHHLKPVPQPTSGLAVQNCHLCPRANVVPGLTKRGQKRVEQWFYPIKQVLHGQKLENSDHWTQTLEIIKGCNLATTTFNSSSFIHLSRQRFDPVGLTCVRVLQLRRRSGLQVRKTGATQTAGLWHTDQHFFSRVVH